MRVLTIVASLIGGIAGIVFGVGVATLTIVAHNDGNQVAAAAGLSVVGGILAIYALRLSRKKPGAAGWTMTLSTICLLLGGILFIALPDISMRAWAPALVPTLILALATVLFWIEPRSPRSKETPA